MSNPLSKSLRWLLNLTVGRVLKWLLWVAVALFAVGFAGFAVYVLLPAHSIPEYQPVDEYVYPGQGWGDEREALARQTYYYTPQGTSLPQGELLNPVRYDWFVHLELPFSKKRFADPEHMRAYRFLVDPAPTTENPDQLPVGFTKHFNTAIGEYVLDITCAACHTGQIHVTKGSQRIAVRIDGGQAMHAFTDMSRGNFAPVLVASLISTYFNPFKFDRFAVKVIGPNYPDGKDALKADLWKTIVALASSGQNNPLRHLYPDQEGFGRTDALGRIANTVFGDHLSSSNYRVANAPVSYPYLWDIWKFDWVQYNASVKQPLARNVGEALGVGAVIPLLTPHGKAIPEEQRYDSSVLIEQLVTIESTLQKLRPPAWQEDLMGPVDRQKAAQGKDLFEQHCVGCHGPHPVSDLLQQAQSPGKSSGAEQWRIEVIPVEEIGTDSTEAIGFVERRYDLTKTGMTDQEVVDLLKPIHLRNLSRTALYRLQSVINGRQEQGLDVGTLPDILANYPNPDATEAIRIPQQQFSQIEAELKTLLSPLPELPSANQTDSPYDCSLECQTTWLLWDVTRGLNGVDHLMDSIDVSSVSEGVGLTIIGNFIKHKYFKDNGISWEDQQCIDGFGALDLPQAIAGYKPRPLEGVWATPPFLHNGSVPNLYQMLSLPENRDRRFFVGRRDYDTKHLGYVTEPASSDEEDGFWLDTTITGNHNTGHAFAADPASWQAFKQDRKANPLPPGVIGPELTDDQRWAILEYLKIHRDSPQTPPGYEPPSCGPWNNSS